MSRACCGGAVNHASSLVIPPDGSKGFGLGIAQAWQKNGAVRPRWVTNGQLRVDHKPTSMTSAFCRARHQNKGRVSNCATSCMNASTINAMINKMVNLHAI